MEEEEIKPDIAYFYGLDYENKTCIDCQGAFPRWISVNHAIIICQRCAERHSKLGFNISFVREMSNEWDSYLLAFIQRGGNGRFIRFSNDYKLTELIIEDKYRTKASENYRKLILSEVLADFPPEQVLMDSALQECGNTIYFPEFDDYKIFTGGKMPHKSTKMTNAIAQSIKTIGEGIGNVRQYIGETDIKGTIIDGSSKAFQTMKDVSGVVYDYSKPVVSFLAKKTYQGAGFLLNQLSYGVSEYQNMQYQKESLEKAHFERDRFATQTSQDTNTNEDTGRFYSNQQQFYCHKQTTNQINEPINNENEQELTTLRNIPKPQIIQNSQPLIVQSIKGLKEDQNKNQNTKGKISQTYEVIIKGDRVNDMEHN